MANDTAVSLLIHKSKGRACSASRVGCAVLFNVQSDPNLRWKAASFLLRVLLSIWCLCFELKLCILPVPSALEGQARTEGTTPWAFLNISSKKIPEVAAGSLRLCSRVGFAPDPKVRSIHLLLVLRCLIVSYGAYSSFLSDVWLLPLKLNQ